MKKLITISIVFAFLSSWVIAQNNCLDFDGVNDYVEIPHQNYYDFGTTDFTVQFWFLKRDADRGHAVTFGGLISNNLCFDFDDPDYTGGPSIWVYWMGTGIPNIIDPVDYSDATWHHCAFTRTGNTMTLYLDGILKGQTNYTGSFSFNGSLFLGWSTTYISQNWYWDGQLDELQIWGTSLNLTEINYYMNNGISNPSSQPDLLGYFDFNDGSGQVLTDLSTNANHGRLGNSTGVDNQDPTWGNCTIPNFDIQNCLDFDGSNDYVEIPNDPSLNPTNQITVEAWYKPVSFYGTGSDPIIDKGFVSHTNPAYQYHLSVVGDLYPNFPSSIGFSISLNGILYSVGTAMNFTVVGQWYHVAAVYNGSKIRFYIDGNLIDSTLASGTMVDYGKPVRIARFTNLTNCLPGQIDEVRIWNDARTEAEIRANCYRQLPNPAGEANLVAYYQFNETSGTTLPDLSSNSNDGTLTNMDPATDWIASTAPIPYQSIVDGSWNLNTTWNDGQMVPVNDWSRVEVNHLVSYGAYETLEDLTINSGGQLDMGQGYQLNVNGNLVNNAGPNGLILRSNYLETATIIENNGVEATVERSFAGNDLDWHLISPPVSNALSGVFNDMYLQSFNETTNTYSEIIPSSVPLNAMQGYAVYSDLANMNTVSYTGNLNTGTLNRNLTANMANGWNLVGNPYPSALDWNAVIPGLSGINSSIYYLDAASGNWLTWNGTTGSGSRYAPPGQGFFVSATTAATLSFDNSMRTHDVFWMFYKEGVSDLLVVKAEGNGFEDKTYVHFNNGATEGFDGQFDAYKIFSEFNPQLPQVFTKAGGDKLSINELPETNSMVLGFKAGVPGLYSIGLEEASGFSTVVLEDTKTGLTMDLLSSPYNFSHSVDGNAERFILHFSPLGVDEMEAGDIQVYSVEDIVYVGLPGTSPVEYSVLNMMGQEIKAGKLGPGTSSFTIDSGTGYYVVKIINAGTMVSEKVFIPE